MFNTENRRTQLLSVALVGILLLAGCSTQQPPEIHVAGGAAPVDSTVTTVLTTEQNHSLQARASETEPSGAALDEKSRLRVEKLSAQFYQNLPSNNSERRQVGFETARATCDWYRDLTESTDLNTAQQTGKMSEDLARRLAFTTQIANERFTDSIPTHSTDTLRGVTDDATKYVPLINSYISMSECACDATETRAAEDLEAYYTASLVFGVDTLLLSTGAFYQPAFASTRFITNKASQVGLYRLRYITGDRGWALAMSEVHWALRGEMTETAGELAGRASEMGWNVSRTGVDWQFIAQAQGVNASSLVQGVSEEKLPKNVSWAYSHSNATHTVNVTVGNYTERIAAPADTNDSQHLDYHRVYANLSELDTSTKILLNETTKLTGVPEENITNSTDELVGAAEDTVDKGVNAGENATECLSNSTQDSEGGSWYDRAKDTGNISKDCLPIGSDDGEDGVWSKNMLL